MIQTLLFRRSLNTMHFLMINGDVFLKLDPGSFGDDIVDFIVHVE